MTQHRHQWNDAGPSCDQEDGPFVATAPDEETADRTAELDPVSHTYLTDQIRRHLPFVQPLDRDREPGVVRRGGDRVATLRLVTILGGQADVEVLASVMSGPLRHFEDQAGRARRLLDQIDHLAEPPGQRTEDSQSPQYRCSRQGSPCMLYPFDSQKPGFSSFCSTNPRTHLALFHR